MFSHQSNRRLARPVALLLALAGAAQAATHDFLGGWINMDPADRGITRVQISREPEGLQVRVFGKCHPTDCDWGVAPLTTYGRHIRDTDHQVASVVFEQGFATTTLLLRLHDNTLNVEALTHFTDDSGRQNFRSTSAFRRPPPTAAARNTPPARPRGG